MKRAICILLVLAMILPLAACGEKKNETADPGSSGSTTTTTKTESGENVVGEAITATETDSDLNSKGEPWLPLVPEGTKTTVTIGVIAKSNVTDYEDNALTKWIEEQTGLDLQFRLFSGTSSDVATQVALMIAANETLPDVMFCFDGISKATAREYCRDGYFADLKDYFANPDLTHFRAMGFRNMFGDNTTVEKNLMAGAVDPATGAIYSYPVVQDVPLDSPDVHTVINQVWLDKLGLKAPTNVDELYNVLVHFRDDDPNGNGVRDEIPMIARCTGNFVNIVTWIMNAFVFMDDTYTFNVTDGKVWLPHMTEEYRKGIIYIRKLVDEGLLSPMTWTLKAAELKALENPTDGVYTVGITAGHGDTNYYKDTDSVFVYTPLAPLADATGKGGYGPLTDNPTFYSDFITTSAADPELCFRLLDFMCSPECSIRMRFGEYGVDWVWSEGKGDSNMGNAPVLKLLNAAQYSETDNRSWHSGVTLMSEGYAGSYEIDLSDKTQWDTKRVLNIRQNYENYLKAGQPAEVFYAAIYTDEELERRTEISSDITTYLTKSRTNFCTGVLDPNSDADWNDYLDNLKKLYADEFVALTQSGYTRAQQR